MDTQNRYSTITCRNRRSKITALKNALKHIGYSRRYQGASISTTINFDATYNRPDQIAVYGRRSRQEVARMSEDECQKAKANFASACSLCEFRFQPDQCRGQNDEARVFDTLLDDQKVRNRFSSRINNEELGNGYKAAPCLRLLKTARFESSEWTIW